MNSPRLVALVALIAAATVAACDAPRASTPMSDASSTPTDALVGEGVTGTWSFSMVPNSRGAAGACDGQVNLVETTAPGAFPSIAGDWTCTSGAASGSAGTVTGVQTGPRAVSLNVIGTCYSTGGCGWLYTDGTFTETTITAPGFSAHR